MITATRPETFPATSIPDRRHAGIALAFGAACISGVAVFVNGYGVRHFHDATVYTTVKNLVAAAVLLALVPAAGRLRSTGARASSAKARWLGYLCVGLVGGSVPFVLFFEGLSRASTVQAAFIQKTLVVWVALLALVFLRERLRATHLAAIGLLIGGQAVLTRHLGALRIGGAETMILAATWLWAIETVIAKRIIRDAGSLSLAAARMAIGTVALLAYVAMAGRWSHLASLDAEQWRWAILTGLILAAYVAMWYAALMRAPATDVTAMLVFGAVVTAALSAAVNGTRIAPDALGLALIAGGALAAGMASRRRRPAAAHAHTEGAAR